MNSPAWHAGLQGGDATATPNGVESSVLFLIKGDIFRRILSHALLTDVSTLL